MTKNKVVLQQNITKLNPYNETFFKRRETWLPEYDKIAIWINDNVNGNSLGDVGCGNGYIIGRLHSLGKVVWGVDASKKFVDKRVREYVKEADLTRPLKLPKSDVILCFDVADRIDQQHTDRLLKNIISTKADIIMFTASEPGKAGIHHVNLQPRQYWLDKFGAQGYYLDAALMQKFRRELDNQIKHPTWYLEDIMIFRRYSAQSIVDVHVRANEAIENLTVEVRRLRTEKKKLEDELWLIGQRLDAILGSARWRVSSKLIRLVKR